MNLIMNTIISLGLINAAVTNPSIANNNLTASYNGRLRLLEDELLFTNEVTYSLKFRFWEVDVIEPTATTPIIVTEVEPVSDVLSIYEAAKDDSYRREIYITFNTENADPPISPTLRYALKIAGLASIEFCEFVRLFTIWLLRNDIPPANVGVDWFTQGLYVVFPISYSYNDQVVIVGFNAVATSATYMDNILVVAGVTTENIIVRLTSEIFTSNTQAFSGILIPEDIDLTPFNRFVPYIGYPSQQMLALTQVSELIHGSLIKMYVSRNEFRAIGNVCARLSLKIFAILP